MYKRKAIFLKGNLKTLSSYFIARFCNASSSGKKDMSHPMQSTANVVDIENGWYEWWEKNNFFRRTDAKENFVMILPPPNVTGKLHMGHALTCAVQDAFVRWNQMNGRKVLWIPGCDHAGIATQVVVERHLWETQKLSRHDLGRERFLEEIENWKDEKLNTIYKQMKRMGVAIDWQRSLFTLDPGISSAVTEAFIRLFNEQLIYRANYMINWCCILQSTISDFEVEHYHIDGPTSMMVPGHDEPVTFGYMYDVMYQLSGSDERVTVSTTRPETILGDTALMVHPEDNRFTHLHGKSVLHPFWNHTIPVITDRQVSREFGTGVVKVTPGHDFVDFEIGKRHDLPILDIYDEKGCIIEGPDLIKGKPRYLAREWILNNLAVKGLYKEKKPHAMQVPKCMRSGDIIEPRLKLQWFLSTKKLSLLSLKAVSDGDLRLHPPEFSKVWENFLSEDKDWCISRQLWWGHRIPIYWASLCRNSMFGNEEKIKDSTSVFVAASNEEEAYQKAASLLGVYSSDIKCLQRENDVLDTWFSSAMLPFTALGWPEDTSDYNNYYPLSLLETGHDILFFWVARMVMMGLQLTNRLPFKDVLLHGLVCDAQGHKMSKSKGNALDPMDIIDGCTKANETKENIALSAGGADALRFTLCSYDIKKNLISLDLRIFEQDFFLRNKIWQTIRFLLQTLEKIPFGHEYMKPIHKEALTNPMDLWIMSRLSNLVSEANRGFQNYDLYVAAHGFKSFWYSNLCDVYLEAAKLRLWNYQQQSSENVGNVLSVIWSCCHTGLLILSPLMPFLTEELYQRIPSVEEKYDSIMQCSYPHHEKWCDFRNPLLEKNIDQMLETAVALRNLKQQYYTNSKSKGKASIIVENEQVRETLEEVKFEIAKLSFLSEVNVIFGNNAFEKQEGVHVRQVVSPNITVQLNLQGLIDPETEINRLTQRLAKLEKEKTRLELGKRPKKLKISLKEYRERDAVKLASIKEEINKVKEFLENISQIKL